jgi:hypothetical protein
MYFAVATYPDISFAVGVLAQFNKYLGLLHWKAVKHLFRYLKGTLDYKLTYKPSRSSELFTTFTDTDHARNIYGTRAIYYLDIAECFLSLFVPYKQQEGTSLCFFRFNSEA